MERVVTIPANGVEAAKQVMDAAEERGVRLRLLGGVAFKIACPSALDIRLARENKDIDLIGRREDTKKIMRTLEDLGYKPREVFNKMNMGRQLIYYDMVNMRRADIFLDEFVMCHKFNFKNSLLPGTYTLPITELVMTKLQVVEITEKEFLDLMAAFHDYDVADDDESINARKIAQMCSKDWGLSTTFTKSLAALRERVDRLNHDDRVVMQERVDRLAARIRDEPKSLSWRIRARVGESARWYELPESPGDAMLD